MDFNCQAGALQELSQLAQSDRHSVLIDGAPGCGKSWLASQYGKMCNAADIINVQPSVDAIRDTVEQCYTVSNTLLVCIENLDRGVPASAHALLKFLEEPQTNVYVVVTCINIRRIPDTIVSRSACVTVARPTADDILNYARHRNAIKLDRLLKRNPILFEIVKTFSDVDDVLALTDEQVEYFIAAPEFVQSSSSISDAVWKLGHFPSNAGTPIELMIRYLIHSMNSPKISTLGLQCLDELSKNRIAAHAVLAKFVMSCKYG